MAEWRYVEYQELSAQQRSAFSMGPFGSKITKDNYVATGVPVVRGVNLARGIFVDDDFVFITEEKADEIMAANVEPGDLIFTHRGTIGQVSMIPRAPRFNRYVIGSSQVKTRLDATLALPEFYYYWFQSGEGQRSILANSSTVGVPGIATPLTSIRKLHVPLPPRRVQEGIVAVLGALDDKIAINERIAVLTADLISQHFGERVWNYARGGALAEGYRQGQVQDMCEAIGNGATPKRKNGPYWDGGTIDWYKTGELLDGPLLKSAERITDTGLAESSCKLWPAGTVLVALYASPTVGRMGILEHRAAFNQACSGLRAKRALGELILYETIKATRHGLQKIAVGAAQQNISKAVLSAHRVVIPAQTAADRFNQIARPLYRRRVFALAESRALATLRDALLPQLMSGKLRVAEAEKIVEDAV